MLAVVHANLQKEGLTLLFLSFYDKDMLHEEERKTFRLTTGKHNNIEFTTPREQYHSLKRWKKGSVLTKFINNKFNFCLKRHSGLYITREKVNHLKD